MTPARTRAASPAGKPPAETLPAETPAITPVLPNADSAPTGMAGLVLALYPAEVLGRLSTSSAVVNYRAIPAGALLGGLAAGSLGVRATLWLMIAFMIVSSRVLLIGPLRTLRDLPAPDWP